MNVEELKNFDRVLSLGKSLMVQAESCRDALAAIDEAERDDRKGNFQVKIEIKGGNPYRLRHIKLPSITVLKGIIQSQLDQTILQFKALTPDTQIPEPEKPTKTKGVPTKGVPQYDNDVEEEPDEEEEEE